MTSIAKKRAVKNVRSEFIGFKLDKAMTKRLDVLASTQGASRSFIIRQLLTDALNSNDTSTSAKKA